MHKYMAFFVLLFLMTAGAVAAPYATVPAAVKQSIPDAQKVGSGRMKYLAWDVYDATLYASKGKYTPGKPMALSLRYFRKLKGRDIADRSVQEMRNQGFDDEKNLADWYKQMARVFPNVVSGTVLTGIMSDDGKTIFLKNGKPIGTFNNPEFGKHFFDIWLSEKTSTPDVRKKLLGKL